jgi:hypothetical protein
MAEAVKIAEGFNTAGNAPADGRIKNRTKQRLCFEQYPATKISGNVPIWACC